MVTQPIHAGLIAALREQVIPRLLVDAPQLDARKLADQDAHANRPGSTFLISFIPFAVVRSHTLMLP